ncbi:MAG TPA: thiamine phosphate synthase [Gemmatimonadales bacterium]|nr:thiamine phosphate synthase [Gemmatimonadales bacterium]
MAVLKLPRFYPIFDNYEWLARMLPLGVRFCQLRVKNLTPGVTRLQVRESLKLAADHGAMLVVNDHWQIAIDEGASWVHLGQEDLDSASISALRSAGVRLGISTHDRSELHRALSLQADYVALGPVYPTILKKMKWSPQGLERVSDWKSLLPSTPLCAIGGMTTERAAGVLAAGADTISVVTDITLHAHPERRVQEWLEVTQ